MIKRFSNQRQIVYDSLLALEHSTSEELIEYIKEIYSEISLATIYRNLSVLLDEELITKININGIDYYETTKDTHFHFICKRCNKIQDILPNEIPINIKDIDYINSNKILSFNITFTGICKDCLNKQLK